MQSRLGEKKSCLYTHPYDLHFFPTALRPLFFITSCCRTSTQSFFQGNPPQPPLTLNSSLLPRTPYCAKPFPGNKKKIKRQPASSQPPSQPASKRASQPPSEPASQPVSKQASQPARKQASQPSSQQASPPPPSPRCTMGIRTKNLSGHEPDALPIRPFLLARAGPGAAQAWLLAWWLACWLACWLAGWLTGWLAGWLAGLLAGLACWLACWLAGWHAGWLA